MHHFYKFFSPTMHTEKLITTDPPINTLIDTHCHLDFPQFDEDREGVIARAHSAGIMKMVSIGCHVEAAEKAIEIANTHEGISAAIGIHPCDISEKFPEEFKVIKELAHEKKVVAIGETGLDFFREENPSKMAQFDAFEKHSELAKEHEKPVIVHLRDATKEAKEFFTAHHDFSFVTHCFLGDWDFAKSIFDLGGMISFTGIVTFKNADQDLLDVAKRAPIDRIMVETDSPFLAPVPNRGKRCEPAFTADTARFLAELRGEDFQFFAKETTKNAERFFGI